MDSTTCSTGRELTAMPDFPHAFPAVADPGAQAPENTMPSPQAGPGSNTEADDHLGASASPAANGVPLEAADAAGDEASEGAAAGTATTTRKRPKPGERRVQILQTLAAMLEEPGADRITTAALAAKLSVSEAALYRHFASKAQMFEGLIEFIESSIFTLIHQITERDTDPSLQARRIVFMLLQFGEKNPGMARVMVGDALVFENERLSARMNQFFDKIESQLRQCLRTSAERSGSQTPTVDANGRASALTALAVGRLQRYTRSGFKRSPTEQIELALGLLT
jgi:TetR/AcrR family transcriptional regulator